MSPSALRMTNAGCGKGTGIQAILKKMFYLCKLRLCEVARRPGTGSRQANSWDPTETWSGAELPPFAHDLQTMSECICSEYSRLQSAPAHDKLALLELGTSGDMSLRS